MHNRRNVAAQLSSHEQAVHDFLARCDPDLVAAVEKEYPTLGRYDWEKIHGNEFGLGSDEIDLLNPEPRAQGVALRARHPRAPRDRGHG